MIDLPDRNTITLTAEGIKERHMTRLTVFCREHNVSNVFDRKVLKSPALHEEARRIAEEMRLDYLAMTCGGEGEVVKRDKTQRMLGHLKESIGKEVTAEDFADAAECSLSAAHAFIANNRGWFHQSSRGHYIVIDADAERAAAKTGSPVLAPATPLQFAKEHVAAVAVVNSVLAAMTGHGPVTDDRLPKP